jgi:hypothetical protein
MKILVYGLQSSGATLFAYFLSQKPRTIGLPDLWANYWSPDCSDVKFDMVLKCVVTKNNPIEGHIERYNPNIKILFLRNLRENKQRLCKKPWANENGTPEEKIEILNKIDKKKFDYVVTYDKFLSKKVPFFSEKFYEFNRSKNDIINFNFDNFKWSKDNINRKWGFGEIHFEKKQHIVLSKPKEKFL